MNAATMNDSAGRDAADQLAPYRDDFVRPEGIIYLDGHSLGMMPKASRSLITDALDRQWSQSLIRAWNEHNWIGAPARIGTKIARLIGAKSNEVMVADSTSINLYKLIIAACISKPDRHVILAAEDDFPTDHYMIQGALRVLGGGRVLRTVPRSEITDHFDDTIALMVLTQVDYRSSEVADMTATTKAAHKHGILTLWDLSHSTGVLPLDMNGATADMAVGCGYKYLNGGPGAPSFLFVAERHHSILNSPLQGWIGHAAPFAFEALYRPGPGIAGFQCGTPPILSLLALEGGVDLALKADPRIAAAKARALGDFFIEHTRFACAEFGVALASPDRGQLRGGHVAFRFQEGYALTQALIARGVIGDFREPDFLRFGFSPLTLSFQEVAHAAAIFSNVLRTRSWQAPHFQDRLAVT